MQSAIRQQERLGIDPSATFYTELEVMSSVLSHMNSVHDQNPRGLWIPARRQPAGLYKAAPQPTVCGESIQAY